MYPPFHIFTLPSKEGSVQHKKETSKQEGGGETEKWGGGGGGNLCRKEKTKKVRKSHLCICWKYIPSNTSPIHDCQSCSEPEVVLICKLLYQAGQGNCWAKGPPSPGNGRMDIPVHAPPSCPLPNWAASNAKAEHMLSSPSLGPLRPLGPHTSPPFWRPCHCQKNNSTLVDTLVEKRGKMEMCSKRKPRWRGAECRIT